MVTGVRRSKLVAVVTSAMVVLGVLGAPASASTATPKHRARVSRQLLREVKRHPGVIRSHSFLRRAALVNFKLPVTIRLRSPCAAGVGGAATCAAGSGNTALNQRRQATASVDLGASLGQRTVALGGSLPAEVEFSDTYDGGALGNVKVELLPSSTKFLTSSSVPLLWNPDASDPATRSDANYAKSTTFLHGVNGDPLNQGCGDFYASAPGNTPAAPPNYNALFHGLTPTGAPFGPGNGYPGYPYYPSIGAPSPSGYLPIYPGVDALDNLKTGYVTGDNDWLGPNTDPFPYNAAMRPGAASYGVQDTIFRTNALHLAIAAAGTQVDLATGTPLAPNTLPTGQTSQNVIIGKSGGQANLFGNIPGKSYGIDVTVNVATRINSIARIMDQDTFAAPLLAGGDYPAGIFNCHQVWFGAVQNYIPGIRLTGDLRISPAITKDGRLRIARATVSTSEASHVALSACLFPASAYVDYNDDPGSFGFSDQTTSPPIPPPGTLSTNGRPQDANGLWPVDSDVLPVFMNSEKFDPSDPSYSTFGGNAPTTTACNTPPYKLVERSGLYGLITPYLPASLANGYTTTASGSQATVAGDITVNALDVDILVGDA